MFCFFFAFRPTEHRGPGQDVREMLPAPAYRGQQQLPGQLVLLRFGNQGNQGAGSPLPGKHTLKNKFLTCKHRRDFSKAARTCQDVQMEVTLLVSSGGVLLFKANATPPLQGSRCSSDVVMLGEMMFGSVAMSYKGSTLKIHQIR